MNLTGNQRIGLISASILALDQLTKGIVLALLPVGAEHVILDGFFKFVHWHNDGAAFSTFSGQTEVLAIISLLALAALFLFRHHFSAHRVLGQIALGLMFGGILGNLVDRLLPSRRKVIDFLYFNLQPRGGGEIGFPAFNVADSAICIGVGLLFILSWQADANPKPGPSLQTTRP